MTKTELLVRGTAELQKAKEQIAAEPETASPFDEPEWGEPDEMGCVFLGTTVYRPMTPNGIESWVDYWAVPITMCGDSGWVGVGCDRGYDNNHRRSPYPFRDSVVWNSQADNLENCIFGVALTLKDKALEIAHPDVLKSIETSKRWAEQDAARRKAV